MSDSCDPMDCSPPGLSVHGIFQARILKWVAISFSTGSSGPRNQTGSPALQADSLLTELRQKLFPAISINKGCHVHACDKSLQSCPILCDPMDCSPPGPSVQGTLQERIGSGLSCSPPGALRDPGITPTSLTSAVAGGFFTTSATREAQRVPQSSAVAATTNGELVNPAGTQKGRIPAI